MSMPDHSTLMEAFYDVVYQNFKTAFGGIARGEAHLDAMTSDALNPQRNREQLKALVRHTNLNLQNKRILEIGAGHGMTVACARLEYGAEAFGIEPGDAEFEGALDISHKILVLADLPTDIIQSGVGESIPHEDASFECVFSSNVLEHVQDPELVIKESLRVLKPGGYLHFVVPNYGSWWEGHYGVLWFPHISHFLGKIYVRLLGRDPSFIDTLQFINHGWLKRILEPHRDQIRIVGWGQDVWEERVTTAEFSTWSTLGTVQQLIQFLRRLKLDRVLVWVGKRLHWETPIILTFQKIPDTMTNGIKS